MSLREHWPARPTNSKSASLVWKSSTGRPTTTRTRIPIVRVTAAEIRKRIEHYYQDHKHKHEIRMILPAGSYAPQFYWPGHPSAPPVTSLALPSDASDALNAQPVVTLPDVPRSEPTFLARRKPALAVVSLTLVIAAAALWHVSHPPVLKQFWEPFVNSPNPVLICVADQSQYSTIRLRDAADPSHEITLPDRMVALIIDDVSPLVNVAALLRTYGKTSHVLGESNTTLTDLRRAPSIFIGAFDNSWTLRMTAPLRFHFANDSAMNKLWIEDRNNPGNHNWMMDRTDSANGNVLGLRPGGALCGSKHRAIGCRRRRHRSRRYRRSRRIPG